MEFKVFGGGGGIFSLDEVDWGFIMIIGDLELRGTNFEGMLSC